MPRWIAPVVLTFVVIALIPAALITRARYTRSSTPRINLVPDMDYQLKYLPQTANALFADGRAMRPAPEGTVARGRLAEDERFHRGRSGEDWVGEIPVPVTGAVLRRGRERYGIFCSVCHGLSGYGDGMVHARALELAEKGLANWVPPTSLHDDLVRDRPDGHLFNTITYGIRNMPAYGPQIPPEDRWAIVAYLRALQRSQKATLDDVPAEKRSALR
jgi:mono/diheme cytochrome c family protein